MQLSEIESDLAAATGEHKAALTALGAARASKDAAMREYVEAVARLEIASEPQNEWEVRILPCVCA